MKPIFGGGNKYEIGRFLAWNAGKDTSVFESKMKVNPKIMTR